jgi:hypothetical protein
VALFMINYGRGELSWRQRPREDFSAQLVFGRRRFGDDQIKEDRRPCLGRLQNQIVSGFLKYRVLDEVDENGNDRASDAATGHVTKRCADVESAAARRAKGRNQALQDGSANSAANGTGDRFGEGAEVNILQ